MSKIDEVCFEEDHSRFENDIERVTGHMVWHYDNKGRLTVPDKDKNKKSYLLNFGIPLYITEEKTENSNNSFDPFEVHPDMGRALNEMESIINLYDFGKHILLRDRIIIDFIPRASFIHSEAKPNFRLIRGIYTLYQSFTLYRIDTKRFIEEHVIKKII